MQRVTRSSKKEELWSELERLRLAADVARQHSALFESEATRLREKREAAPAKS